MMEATIEPISELLCGIVLFGTCHQDPITLKMLHLPSCHLVKFEDR